MADKQINARIINKHDLSSNWAKAVNFTPKLGEIVIYDDLNKIKIGDGITNVDELPFVADDTSYLNYKDLGDID